MDDNRSLRITALESYIPLTRTQISRMEVVLNSSNYSPEEKERASGDLQKATADLKEMLNELDKLRAQL